MEVERKRLWLQQLNREFSELNTRVGGWLMQPLFAIESMAGCWGKFEPLSHRIVLAEELITQHSWHAVKEVLKHEVAHLIAAGTTINAEAPHGPAFQAACKALGTSAWASASEADLQPPPAWDAGQVSSEDERLMRRAEKLLALAQSENEHEAGLAMERVRELYLKRHLDKSLGASTESFVSLVLNLKTKRVSSYQHRIFSILNSHYLVSVVSMSVYNAEIGEDQRGYEIMGTLQNVKMAEYVFHFLMNNLPLLWAKHLQGQSVKLKRLKTSYYVGVLDGFHRRLAKQEHNIRKTNSKAAISAGLIVSEHEAELALNKAKEALDAYTSYRFPRLANFKSGGGGVDADTFRAGQAAGGRLNINKPVHAGSTSEQRFLT